MFETFHICIKNESYVEYLSTYMTYNVYLNIQHKELNKWIKWKQKNQTCYYLINIFQKGVKYRRNFRTLSVKESTIKEIYFNYSKKFSTQYDSIIKGNVKTIQSHRLLSPH